MGKQPETETEGRREREEAWERRLGRGMRRNRGKEGMKGEERWGIERRREEGV